MDTMRLIDADKFKRDIMIWQKNDRSEYAHALGNKMLNLIDEQETVDAVPIVRCKDCVHRRNEIVCPMCHEESYDDDGWTEYKTYDDTEDDGFCQYGERSLDEDEDADD